MKNLDKSSVKRNWIKVIIEPTNLAWVLTATAAATHPLVFYINAINNKPQGQLVTIAIKEEGIKNPNASATSCVLLK